MSKYYEVLPLTEIPAKEGWYDLIDPTGDFKAESRYFKKDYWFESEKHAENGTIDEDDSLEGLFWLRPISHLPLSREQADLKNSVAEVMKENERMLWETCSGCHESEDGHDVGEYTFSEIFQCKQGSGCHECGGIGVVWSDFRSYPEPPSK
jgi:hypothetical protein